MKVTGMTVKQQFVTELQPLLVAAEEAINAGKEAESQQLSFEMLALAKKYANKLSPEEFRDALNNPVANAIAKRLGVKK